MRLLHDFMKGVLCLKAGPWLNHLSVLILDILRTARRFVNVIIDSWAGTNEILEPLVVLRRAIIVSLQRQMPHLES